MQCYQKAEGQVCENSVLLSSQSFCKSKMSPPNEIHFKGYVVSHIVSQGDASCSHGHRCPPGLQTWSLELETWAFLCGQCFQEALYLPLLSGSSQLCWAALPWVTALLFIQVWPGKRASILCSRDTLLHPCSQLASSSFSICPTVRLKGESFPTLHTCS